VDWSASPDDPHGYTKLCAAVESFALQLDDLGFGHLATRLRDAQKYVGMPTEWIGETALALNRTLSNAQLPDGLREDMKDAVEAIRTGFRRVGSEPNF
jgi:hypothetical protein